MSTAALPPACALSFHFLLCSETLSTPNNHGEPKATRQSYRTSQRELHGEAVTAPTNLIKIAVSIQAGECASIRQSLTNAWRCIAQQHDRKAVQSQGKGEAKIKSGEIKIFTAILSSQIANRLLYLQCSLQAHLYSTDPHFKGMQPSCTPTPFI